MLNKELYICRVCGLIQNDLPWGEDQKTPSFNICDCCGTEFGYDDVTLQAIRKSRTRWLSQGAEWFNSKSKSQNWIIEKQLKQIPIRFQ